MRSNFKVFLNRTFIVFGGGMLLKVDGKIVGAVGVSGGSAQEDMEIAKACVKAFETI